MKRTELYKDIRHNIKNLKRKTHMQRFRRNHNMQYIRPATLRKLFKTPYGQKLINIMINNIAYAYSSILDNEDDEPVKWWDDKYNFGSILERR